MLVLICENGQDLRRCPVFPCNELSWDFQLTFTIGTSCYLKEIQMRITTESYPEISANKSLLQNGRHVLFGAFEKELLGLSRWELGIHDMLANRVAKVTGTLLLSN